MPTWSQQDHLCAAWRTKGVSYCILTLPPWMLFIGKEKGVLDSSFDPGVNIYYNVIFCFTILLASLSVSIKRDYFLLLLFPCFGPLVDLVSLLG